MGINHKNRMFSRLYKAIKIHLIALWALSQTQMIGLGSQGLVPQNDLISRVLQSKTHWLVSEM